MKTLKFIIAPYFVTVILASCTVSNNLYVNNPIPFEKGDGMAYLGLGTGLEASRDSNLVNNQYVTSYKASIAPVLSFGGQLGITNKFNLRGAFHLPYIVGGFGLRLGCQYSFFNKVSLFNMALGTDLGFTAAKDSLWGSDLQLSTNAIYNVDFFMPMSYSFNENVSLILTPRYSNTWISVYELADDESKTSFRVPHPILSLGLKTKRLFFETSVLFVNDQVYPQFGLALLIL